MIPERCGRLGAARALAFPSYPLVKEPTSPSQHDGYCGKTCWGLSVAKVFVRLHSKCGRDRNRPADFSYQNDVNYTANFESEGLDSTVSDTRKSSQ